MVNTIISHSTMKIFTDPYHVITLPTFSVMNIMDRKIVWNGYCICVMTLIIRLCWDACMN